KAGDEPAQPVQHRPPEAAVGPRFRCRHRGTPSANTRLTRGGLDLTRDVRGAWVTSWSVRCAPLIGVASLGDLFSRAVRRFVRIGEQDAARVAAHRGADVRASLAVRHEAVPGAAGLAAG